MAGAAAASAEVAADREMVEVALIVVIEVVAALIGVIEAVVVVASIGVGRVLEPAALATGPVRPVATTILLTGKNVTNAGPQSLLVLAGPRVVEEAADPTTMAEGIMMTAIEAEAGRISPAAVAEGVRAQEITTAIEETEEETEEATEEATGIGIGTIEIGIGIVGIREVKGAMEIKGPVAGHRGVVTRGTGTIGGLDPIS